MAGLDLDTLELFQQTESEIVMVTIQKLQTQILGQFNVDGLLKELALLKNVATTDHWTFTWQVIMIVRALIILIIGLCCWKECCQTQPLGQPTAYSAPSALPTSLSLT
jgi:hypothetical protein